MLKILFHVIAWVYGFDKGLGMDLGDSFLPKIALFIALLSIYEALMLIHSRAHVEFLCQYIRCVCVFPFLSLWLHIHVCKECCVKLPFCRFFSLLLCYHSELFENWMIIDDKILISRSFTISPKPFPTLKYGVQGTIAVKKSGRKEVSHSTLHTNVCVATGWEKEKHTHTSYMLA